MIVSLRWWGRRAGPIMMCAAGLWSGGLYAGESEDTVLHVFVSVLPQAYFVERVGGPYVTVGTLVSPGQAPETYEPTAQQLVRLERADVYFRIGMLFEERLLAKIQQALPGLNTVDTRTGIALRRTHSDHDRGSADPHIWLDPTLVKTQAATICEELCRIDTTHAGQYRQNLRAFVADLEDVNERIAGRLAPLKGRRLYVFHPAFGYFCDAYGLIEVAVQAEGKEPSARHLADLIEQAQSDEMKTIFVQPEFSSKSAQTLAESIGADVIELDHLSRDYLNNLLDMTEKIVKGLTRNE